MSLTSTPSCNFNTQAIPFELKGIDGLIWNLEKAKGSNGLLVMFICNHCPYVQNIIDRLVTDCKELQANHMGCIAIMSNDYEQYPEDSVENMKIFADKHNFSFPYVIDETQQTAKDYGAVCTPDFFGYNADLKLQYRGRLDSAGANLQANNQVKELLPAMLQIIQTGQGPDKQFPSMGCSIKWKN